jgi:hypothetical protein
LQLNDPAMLRAMIRPQVSPLQLVLLFLAAVFGRFLRADVRRRVRALLRRSYV